MLFKMAIYPGFGLYESSNNKGRFSFLQLSLSRTPHMVIPTQFLISKHALLTVANSFAFDPSISNSVMAHSLTSAHNIRNAPYTLAAWPGLRCDCDPIPSIGTPRAFH